MSTASTKRARKKGKPSAAARPAEGPEERETVLPRREFGGEMSQRAWLIAGAVILLAAALLRLYALGLKPMHHDEGVNGFFLTNLLRNGVYKYDPSNYHGPTLYYFAMVSSYVYGLFASLFRGDLSTEAIREAGLSTNAVRLVTVAFGVGTVWLALALRRYVGAVGALAAAALLAVSPGMVYYSRYFIHETLFVFFTLGVVVAALRFHETGGAEHLLLCAASAAMLFATKETAFISLGTLVLAVLVSWGWARLTRGPKPPTGRRDRRRAPAGYEEAGFRAALSRFGTTGHAALLMGSALAAFLLTYVLFYSSFLTHWKGVWDSFEAFKLWTKTGASEFHSKPYHTYVKWLLQEEAPILVLAVVGAAVALFERRKNRFAVFAGAWAFGLLLAYSLIPYKTPWLVLSFVVPLAITGGYAVQVLDMRASARRTHAPALAVAGVAVAVCAYQAVVLNFRQYDNDRYPYVYSHTQREALELVREVERLAERSGRGREAGVLVASPEYWPLPWYLRDYKGVGYEGRVSSYYDTKSVTMVIGRESTDAKENQLERLRAVLGANYQQVNVYPLRPGVRLVLFARRDLLGT